MANKLRKHSKARNLRKAKQAKQAVCAKAARSARHARRIKAAQAVIFVTELFENILSHLRPAEVLRAKSISKYAQNIIDNSPALRRKLFLETGPNIKHEYWSWSAAETIIRTGSSMTAPLDVSRKVGYRFMFNPVLFCSVQGMLDCKNSPRPPLPILCFKQSVLQSGVGNDCIAVPSCWNMQLTQPSLIHAYAQFGLDLDNWTELGVSRLGGKRYRDTVEAVSTDTTLVMADLCWLFPEEFIQGMSVEELIIFVSPKDVDHVDCGRRSLGIHWRVKWW